MNDRNHPRRPARRPQDTAKRTALHKRGTSSKRSESRGLEKRPQGNSRKRADTSFLVSESWEDIRSGVVKPRRPRSTSASSKTARPRVENTQRRLSKNSGNRRPIPQMKKRVNDSSVAKRRKRKKRTPAMRINHNVLLKILTAIILTALVVVAGWFAVSYVKNANEARKAAKIEASTEKPEVIANCQPSDLQIEISSNALKLISGSLWDAKISLRNEGATSCYTEGGANRYGFQIKSGDVEVYNSLKCATQDSQIPLLLGRGKSWEMKLPWDGKVWVDCKSTKAAEPGTYVATLLNEEKPVGTPQVLTIVPVPEKEPVSKEKPAN